MPAIKCEESVLNELCDLVVPSVVSVNTYQSSKYKLDFATGFIIYSDTSKTLICVHKLAVKGIKSIYVHFSDGGIEKAEKYLNNTPSGHVVLKTGGHARQAASFRQIAAKKEDVFVVAEVEGGYSGFNFMTGNICCPCCKAIDERSGKMIPGSKDTFLMTCAATKWPHEMKTKDQLIGAAVFDMVNGAIIGTITSVDKNAYDLKFASQSCSWINKLEGLLQRKDETIKFKKVSSNKSLNVGKRMRTREINMVQLQQDTQFR